ncbi:sensor histidine kinase [Plantactinospora solaniradicis]|uniref:histidine kinase n=1 Tax=Plantactinospora solaniradicis TaxID=1723736 RepID=A0ABW1K7M7_9ACTN
MPVPLPAWFTSAARLRVRNPYLADGALAVAVAVPLSVPFLTSPPGHVTLLGGVLNAGSVLPLIWRRRAPFTVAVLVFSFASLVSLHHRPGQMLQYSGLVAIYTIADLGKRWQRLSFLWMILLTFPPAALLLKRNTAAEFMFTILLPLTAYLLGTLARTNRARAEAVAERAAELERGREATAARAAAEERNRIARDMHDVLAHAVSVMVVQAEAGPVVLRSDPDQAERSFDVIAEAGRSAMAELSSTLGVLKEEKDLGVRLPPPTVAALPSLLDQVRRAGLSVQLHTEGRPRPLPTGVDTAGYRIVQEALTNTLKHAETASASVRLEWAADDLVITVTDDGRCRTGGPAPYGGHGLVGIRQRAAECGGVADAGPTATGFRVSARLPLGGEHR